MNPHRTLLILKPDGYKRNLLVPVLSYISPPLCDQFVGPIRNVEYPVRVIRIETRRLTDKDVNFLYGRYKREEFYEDLRFFMVHGPSIIMDMVGNHAVSRVRRRVGEGGYPYPPVTIRGRWATSTRRNVVHCSDCTKSAVRELKYFFPKDLS